MRVPGFGSKISSFGYSEQCAGQILAFDGEGPRTRSRYIAGYTDRAIYFVVMINNYSVRRLVADRSFRTIQGSRVEGLGLRFEC